MNLPESFSAIEDENTKGRHIVVHTFCLSDPQQASPWTAAGFDTEALERLAAEHAADTEHMARVRRGVAECSVPAPIELDLPAGFYATRHPENQVETVVTHSGCLDDPSRTVSWMAVGSDRAALERKAAEHAAEAGHTARCRAAKATKPPESIRVYMSRDLKRRVTQAANAEARAASNFVVSVLESHFTGPDYETELRGVYRERARLVALVSTMAGGMCAMAPAVDLDEEMGPEHGWWVILMQLPTENGLEQVSWHIAPADLDLFGHVRKVAADDPAAEWDGHPTEEKYARVARCARFQAQMLRRYLSGEDKPPQAPYGAGDPSGQGGDLRVFGSALIGETLPIGPDSDRTSG